jgi:hypothetical protein
VMYVKLRQTTEFGSHRTADALELDILCDCNVVSRLEYHSTKLSRSGLTALIDEKAYLNLLRYDLLFILSLSYTQDLDSTLLSCTCFIH